MPQNAHKEDLERQYREVVKSFCEEIGCSKCPYERDDGGCRATDLQKEIIEVDLERKYG